MSTKTTKVGNGPSTMGLVEIHGWHPKFVETTSPIIIKNPHVDAALCAMHVEFQFVLNPATE